MYYYGIDLGTNNCVISSLNKKGDEIEIELLKDKYGKTNIKSAISLDDISSVKIGNIEIDNLANSFYLLKGKLGNEKSVVVNGNRISVQYCAALLLNYIRRLAIDASSVVITIPTFYNQSKRNATREAALQAGFKEVKLIEEPTAAAMYHLYKIYNKNRDPILKNRRILVFDFGGGTLDLSLVEANIEENGNINPKVIVIDGIDNFGGYLIDIYFAKFLLKAAIDNIEENKYKVQVKEAYDMIDYHINSYKDNNIEELYRGSDEINKILYTFIKVAEETKIELSKNKSSLINIDGVFINEEITRDIFNEYILSQENILHKIKNLLKDFKLRNTEKIDEVILVGGSSQIKEVEKCIDLEFSESRITKDNEYINAVSYGSAIISALENGEDIPPFGGNVCTGVIPRDIFLECNGKEEKILESGRAYPLKEPEKIEFKIPFSLTECININIYEKDARKKYNISDIKFYHPFFFTGDIINLYVDIDENGMLAFKATHKYTKESIEFTAVKENCLSNKQIEKGRSYIENMVIFGGE